MHDEQQSWSIVVLSEFNCGCETDGSTGHKCNGKEMGKCHWHGRRRHNLNRSIAAETDVRSSAKYHLGELTEISQWTWK